MRVLRRFSSLLAVGAVVAVVASPALAVDEPTDDTVTDTTVTDTTAGEGEEGQTGPVPPPAVTVPPTAAEEETPDWTYRYLIPTLLALAAIVVIVTTVQYFVRVVRSRYKVVE